MDRNAVLERNTRETSIRISLDVDGRGETDIATGIPFFDHMLTLFAVHGLFDLTVQAVGDIDVDFHHTVEDTGLVLGDVLDQALGDRKGIVRYGHAVTPMDEALTSVSVDLSRRPYLIYNVPGDMTGRRFDLGMAREFFRALAVRGGMNLHITAHYGDNEHHLIESMFKGLGRALDQATRLDERIVDVRSSKGAL